MPLSSQASVRNKVRRNHATAIWRNRNRRPGSQGRAARRADAGLFLLFITVSFVVFAVGHSAWIPYEWRLAARAGLALALLATTIGLRRSERLRAFWPISLAYLAVSLGMLLALIAGRWLPDPDSLASSP